MSFYNFYAFNLLLNHIGNFLYILRQCFRLFYANSVNDFIVFDIAISGTLFAFYF